MVTQSGIERKVSKNGIEVIVIINQSTYDVYITIKPEVDISAKYKCEEFIFKFISFNNSKQLKEPIYLERKNRKYKKNSRSQHVKFTFQNENCRCEISLAPILYVPKEELIRSEQKRNSKTIQREENTPT